MIITKEISLEEINTLRQILEEFVQKLDETQKPNNNFIDRLITQWSEGNIEILGKYIDDELVGIVVLELAANKIGIIYLSTRGPIHDVSQSKDLERNLFDAGLKHLRKRERWVGIRNSEFLSQDLLLYTQEKDFKKYNMIDMVADRRLIESIAMPEIPSGYSLESYSNKMNEDVANLIYECFKNSVSYYADPDLLSTPERCFILLDDTIKGHYGDFKNGRFSFALKKGDEIIGVTLCTLLNDTSALTAGMCLSKRYRGRGLGKLQFIYSLKHLLKMAPEVSEIHLSVYDTNPAKYLYESVGFREISRNHMYTWMQNNDG